MGSAMTLTRREALMDVLKKVCLDPIMNKAYTEAEARLRKNSKFVEFEKVVKAVDKVKKKLKAAEEKLERELDEVSWFFDENGLVSPGINTNIHNDIEGIEIKREGREVFFEVGMRHSYHKTKISERVDLSSSEAMMIVDEAMDLAELCTKELELINLIRETKEKLATLKQEPKKKAPKKKVSKKKKKKKKA